LGSIVLKDDPTMALALLRAQRDAFFDEGIASAPVRMERLDRALNLLIANQVQICAAVAADFGQRPAVLTQLMDIFPSVHALKFARRNLRSWMRPQRRRLSLPIGVPGTRGKIIYQPLGVVGVISPWNFPLTLTFGPLAGILAAGNRCLIKPSEVTPATSELMRQLIDRYFDATEVSVVTGGTEVAESFSQLPFDHLLFTGSAAIGRRVMAAAAQNLVPVTLELGGKCPVVVGRSADLARAVDRILTGKLANAGQMCLAPDYVYIPRGSLDDFVREAQGWSSRAYPALYANPDYTSAVSDRHMQRALDLLADARAKGAQIIALTDDTPTLSDARRLITPALVIGVTDEMRIMQEEIFAPLLPLRAYQRMDEVITGINRCAPPLALYYFGHDAAEESVLVARTRSGGVTINDVAMHFLAEELPFGGVGASGMGAYHGEYGFQRFSHARAIFRQTRFDVSGLLGMRPPYGARLRRSLRFLIRR
jgi:coniferyl-aldehyde dehydrogenase